MTDTSRGRVILVPDMGENGNAASPANEAARSTAAKRWNRANDQIRLGSSDRMNIVTPPFALAAGDSPTSVYLYRDDNGVLIYVGITSRGIQRNREHNSTKDWWRLVASQEVEHYPTRRLAEERERALIAAHMPPFNTHHNPEHRLARAAYEHFRSAPESGLSLPEAIAALPQRHLALDHHKVSGGDHLILRTRVGDAQVAAALAADDSPRVYGFGKRATVARIEHAGPFALIHFNGKAGAAIQEAHAVVKCDRDQPHRVARLKVIHVNLNRNGAVA